MWRRPLTTLATLRRGVQAATPALALGTAALTAALAACSDSPTGPTAAVAARAPGSTGPEYTANATLSQEAAGDTTVTTFVVGNNNTQAASYALGNNSKITFPLAAASICDPSASTYGAGTWNSPCAAAKTSVTIVAKTWVDGTTGKIATDFQPALRFVPGPKNKVTLYLHDPIHGMSDAIWYCPAGGTCVNEAATDPALATQYNSSGQWVYRAVKHFSGYTVIVN